MPVRPRRGKPERHRRIFLARQGRVTADHEEGAAILSRPFADAIGNDCFAGTSERQEHVLIAKIGRIAGFQMTLFLGNEARRFIQLDPGDVKTAHHRVVKRVTTVADAHAKAHDRVAVNANQPFDRSV
jgi:nickel-dependent lactate racemase